MVFHLYKGVLLHCIRPRASSVAEKLWSDALMTTKASVAQDRLHNHRCRMLEYANIDPCIALVIPVSL